MTADRPGGAKVTDAYFPGGRPERALFYPGPRTAAAEPWLAGLASSLARASEGKAGGFTVRAAAPADADGADGGEWLFRGQRAQTVDGALLVFRRLAGSPPDLDGGLLPKPAAALLAHAALCKGGLLAVCGGPGQGKTTTLAATVAARLRAFGGVCVAAEDPPEIPLDGRHGAGLCLLGR